MAKMVKTGAGSYFSDHVFMINTTAWGNTEFRRCIIDHERGSVRKCQSAT